MNRAPARIAVRSRAQLDRTDAYRQRRAATRKSQVTSHQLVKADSKPPTLASDSPTAHYFAARVESRLSLYRGLLPYSSRLTLLKEAQSLGIARFEANLIIAVVQHRFVPQSPMMSQNSPARHRWLFPAAVALTVQLALLTLLYLALSA